MVRRQGASHIRRKSMLHEQEQRHIYYDPDLKIEAYNLIGIVQKFPNHFHECYVIGFVEGGCRHLWCKDEEYDLKAGDLILFNPRDNHYCAPLNGEHLDYRALNIDVDIMEKAAYEITGERYLPHFSSTVLRQSDITPALSKVCLLYTSPAFGTDIIAPLHILRNNGAAALVAFAQKPFRHFRLRTIQRNIIFPARRKSGLFKHVV